MPEPRILRQFFKQSKKLGVHPLDFMEKKVMEPSIPGAGSSKDRGVLQISSEGSAGSVWSGQEERKEEGEEQGLTIA